MFYNILNILTQKLKYFIKGNLFSLVVVIILIIVHQKSLQMKTKTKLIVAAFTAAALFFTTAVKAQTTPANALRFGIGIEAADPLGNARIGTTFILGGTARLQYGLSNNFAITFASGAYHFFPKYIPGTTTRYGSYGIIPIKAGIKEFFVKSIYFGAEAGVGIEASANHTGPTKLLLSPALGWADQHWDIGVRYESFSGQNNNYGLVGLRVAYGFAL
jgi:hypothetical protein